MWGGNCLYGIFVLWWQSSCRSFINTVYVQFHWPIFAALWTAAEIYVRSVKRSLEIVKICSVTTLRRMHFRAFRGPNWLDAFESFLLIIILRQFCCSPIAIELMGGLVFQLQRTNKYQAFICCGIQFSSSCICIPIIRQFLFGYL